jgi:hypothetical protein
MERQMSGYGPFVTTTNLENLRSAEYTYADTLMGKYWKEMLLRAYPTRRKFALTYNLAELKDLPMMIRNSVQLYRNLTKLSVKDVGNLHLNIQFGWKQVLEAVFDMLQTPTRVAKEINYLLKRRGLATSFRSKMKFLDGMSFVPTFGYNFMANETNLVTYPPSGGREAELRCVINAVVNFPNLDVPRLREELYSKFMGASLRPDDVYNLVPWTWLIDWFAGAGRYIDLIDTVNTDRFLINYGFLTYQSSGSVTGNMKVNVVGNYSFIMPGSSVGWSQTETQSYSPKLVFKHTIRKDLSSYSGMKNSTTLTGVSGSQLAILGALIAKFT